MRERPIFNVFKSAALTMTLAALSGCVEADDTAQDTREVLPQQRALTAAQPIEREQAPEGQDVEISRGEAAELLSAIKAHDVALLNQLLPDLYQVNSVVQTITQGPMTGKAALSSPVYFRHSASPMLKLLVADDAPLQMQLWDVDGQLHDISFEREQVEGGWWSVSVKADALPAQGLLLLGPAQHELKSLDINVWAMAIMDEPDLCSAQAAQCAGDELKCIVQAHASCIDESLDVYELTDRDRSAAERISRYIEARSSRFKQVRVLARADGRYDLSWSGDGEPTRLYELFEDGSQRELSWSMSGPGQATIDPQGQSLDPMSVLILSDGQNNLERMGAASTPSTSAARVARTWTLQGCLQFRDDWLQFGQPNVPLRNIQIRVSSSLLANVYDDWPIVRTDNNGCFSATRTFNGVFSGSERDLRVKMRFADGPFTLWNIISVDGVLHGGFTQILDIGGRRPGINAIGTRVFAPGQPGRFGEQVLQRQAASFEGLRRLNAALTQRHPWLGYNGPYHVNYPMPFNGWAITPPNPLSVLNPWNPALTGHAAFISDDMWAMGTIIHESAHAWHYKHKSGAIPNIIPGFIGPIQVTTNGNVWPWQWTWTAAWGTHNCQEDDNIAFLEGFAEYVEHEALCGAVFNSPICTNAALGGLNAPWELDNLEDARACIQENQPPLSTEARMVRNDDGVTHGLKLLTTQDHYRRDYNHVAGTWTQSADVVGGINLSNACRWGSERFDLFDVMWAFRANAAAGHPTDFPISLGNGLLQFYQRFADIHQTHANFIPERRLYLTPQTTQNPWQQCFARCNQLSQMWNGSSAATPSATANQCDVRTAPASATLFTVVRQWFAQPQPTCLRGTWDGANCYVASPPPGTTAFVWNGGMYTTPQPGNVCPIGVFDNANCYLGHPPAGTTAFVWSGSLYTTSLMSCPIGQLDAMGRCFIGTAPQGTQALITGNNVLSYIE